MPWRPALAQARQWGADGIEVHAIGDFAPRNLSQTGRRELCRLVRAHDLELAALVCPLRHGLDIAENQQPRIELVRDVMSLSFDLGARKVVVEAGKIPDKPEEAPRLGEALTALAGHGDRIGATLALETGTESGEALANYLGRFDTGSLGACFNPGNLLVSGHAPYTSARALGQRIVYAHATDARLASPSRGVRNVPAGHGDVDWLLLLATLEEITYHGWLTLPADVGADAGSAISFLRRLLGKPE